MKILFMGTTDYAVACLDAMRKAGYEAAAVCTKVDKPKNRGMKMTFSPVKDYALQAGIPVLQPETLKTEEAVSQLREVGADLFVVVAYGKLLPRAVLDLPKLGCINVHGSLLPKYRGAAPIQWAVLNGERQTGVSVISRYTSRKQPGENGATDILRPRRLPPTPLPTATPHRAPPL